MAQQSYSQSKDSSALQRLAYGWRLGLMYLRRLSRPADFSGLQADVDFYRATYSRLTGSDLRQARILELGFGQRPFRLILLQSLGHDVRGIDLDSPLYRIDPGTVGSLFKSNGSFRAIKSLVRALMFDRIEYRRLADHIFRISGQSLRFDPTALVIGDLSSPAVWRSAGASFDFIYSEDVFEHIPREVLPDVVSLMAGSMSDRSVAVVTPMIFTGISGGHDIAWYPHRADREDASRTPPWGHLTGEAVLGDTHLNRLTRKEFRALFAAKFDILQEEETRPDLGRRHLTEERRQALKAFDEQELFSNTVRFVLRKKKAAEGV